MLKLVARMLAVIGVAAVFSYGPTAAAGEASVVFPRCDTDGGSESCFCMGDPHLGDLWCEGTILLIQPDCFNDYHCNL